MGLKVVTTVALAMSLCLGAAREGEAGEAKAPAPATGKAVKRAKQAKSAAPRADLAAHVLDLRSNVALVVDNGTGEAVVAKNVRDVQPIASITKLMTALVVLDARPALDQPIAIAEEDIDSERGSRSRLKVGSELSRGDLLHLALMASENRAAHALGRSHPGGLTAFVAAMNEKARALGMERTRFVDPTGLSSANVSTAEDLVKLVAAAHAVPLIRRYSTDTEHGVAVAGREIRFHNTNRLVSQAGWEVLLSKTGFINEAGRCLVMQARVDGRALTFVLLDSWGKFSRIGDANRIRKWLTGSAAARAERRA